MLKLKQVTSIAILLCCVLASNCGARQTLDKVVAIVNGNAISSSELDNFTKLVLIDLKASGSPIPSQEDLTRQVLNRMILDKIQQQRAISFGIEVDSLSVSQALKDIASNSGQSLQEFKRDVEDRGISFDDYRDIIKNQLTAERLQAREVMQDIAVSKNDIESFLRSPAGQDNTGVEYRLSHILIPTSDAPTNESIKKIQTQAEEIVAKLKKGADFAKLAASHSSARQALNGGDLGWRTYGEVPSIFANYTSKMQVGEVIGPIRNTSGFHIIKLQDKRSNSRQNTEAHVRQILVNNSAEANSIYQQLKSGADFTKVAKGKALDLGWVTESNVIAKLRNNEISAPFSTDEGWNIVQVIDRRTKHNTSEEDYQKAAEILTNRKTQEAIEAWLKRIRDEAHVDILLS